MASVPTLFILSFFLFVYNVEAQTKHSNTIKMGSSFSPSANTSWSSPSGLFAFGFYPQGNGFAVGIWMVNHTGSIIVWTANRDDPPVSSNAILELKEGGLLLRTEQGKEKPITNNISSTASSASMLDDGNFVLLNNFDDVIWQSFDHPTETILGGQKLGYGMRLQSSISSSDHSGGRFLLVMQGDGNLVSYPMYISDSIQTAYWASGTFDNGVDRLELYLNRTGNLLVQGGLNRTWNFFQRGGYGGRTYTLYSNPSNPDINNKSIIYAATLDDDGIFRLYSHDIVDNRSSGVKVLWSSMQNQCLIKGYCGLNSFCQVVNSNSDCNCYPGFALINPSNKLLGCYQNFVVDSCRDNEDPRQRYKITSLMNIMWDDNPYRVDTQNEEDCRGSCLQDCNCWAVLYTSNSCRKFNFPLRYGKKNLNISETALFKVVLENIGDPNHTNPAAMLIESKNNTVLILALSLGAVACLCFVFAVSSFIVYKHRYNRYKKLLENANLGLAEHCSLQSFSYNELVRATNGFEEEIGRGTFGRVYKGILSESGNKTVAVKRLEKVVEEGVREFRAEMTTIGRTYHRNLVQLLGFCIEGSKKLLVYEFMSNGSLADHLFKAVLLPTWRQRVRYVLDVARGIFYLHEECGVHIIHCNLKPQNILLDDTFTAKISDFGLARLIMPNQAKTSMGVEGTSIGYFAPEWQKKALISVKSDIYSFGVVLLEILCCRRNIELEVSTPDEITLCKWVYRCYNAGELNKLVEDAEEVDLPTLERMVKVGLWCIQDDPASRPLMKNVILMLEGTMDIPVPPSPEPLLLP